MVILLLITLLLGGDDMRLMMLLDHAKEPIKISVTDKTRRTELLAVIKAAEQSTKAFGKERDQFVEEYARLEKKSTTADESLQRILDQLLHATAAFQDEMIRHRFDLKKNMTREEWVRIYSSPVENNVASGQQ